MSELQQGQFDLCPKCGAVARDGVCQSCGYEIPDIVEEAVNKEQTAESGTTEIVYTTPDVYQSQTGEDIYQAPDIHVENYDTGGLFSGEQRQNTVYGDPRAQYDRNPYSDQGNPYGNMQNENNAYGKNLYENNTYGKNQYGSGQYGNNQYGNNQYGNNQYGSGQYGNNQYGNGQYGNNQYGNSQYGNNQCGNGQYGNNQYGNSQYGNPPYGNNTYRSPYGPDQYGYSPYSPYAVPPKRKNTGLIVGVIITVIILFLIALLTLLYHAIETASQKREAEYLKEFYRDYFGEDDRERDYPENDHEDRYGYEDDMDADDDDSYVDNYYDDDYNYGYDDDHDYGYDDYGYDYNYDDDEYYTLHDDIKDLSYSIEWEEFVYDTNEENVSILVQYPVVVGSHIPNLDKINNVIAEEVSVFTDYYEEEYSGYMYDDSSYFNAYSAGYVTYMSEDILSVVFSEYVYSDYFDSIYLYSINIDMQDGVILDNTDILAVDDAFSIDFRYRSDEQNGTISELDWLTDQEITQLLSSDGNLIVFYTPQGMEIGFNYDEGWVTVTYHDYKDYLKIF